MHTQSSDRIVQCVDKELAITRITLILRQSQVTGLFCETLADELELLRPPLSGQSSEHR
jgi:hypothetical protein